MANKRAIITMVTNEVECMSWFATDESNRLGDLKTSLNEKITLGHELHTQTGTMIIIYM